MKIAFLILLTYSIYETLNHTRELDKLKYRIHALSSKPDKVCPIVRACPVCQMRVVELPCELECPEQLECERCQNYWEMCIVGD